MKRHLTAYRMSMLAVILLSAATIVTIEYSGLFSVKSIAVNGVPATDGSGVAGARPASSLAAQPYEEIARTLLDRADIYQTSVRAKLPGSIEIRLNDYEAVAMLVDSNSGRLYGLSPEGLLLPDSLLRGTEHLAVISGTTASRPFSRPPDSRVQQVIAALPQMKVSAPELFASLGDIDLSDPERIHVRCVGLPLDLTLTIDSIVGQFERANRFLYSYDVDPRAVRVIDLSFGALLVAEMFPADSSAEDTTLQSMTKRRVH